MAATKLIAIHQNKGLTLEQTLGIRCDYIKNKDKTDDGRLVTSYSCNPDLVDQEFLLSKKMYLQKNALTIYRNMAVLGSIAQPEVYVNDKPNHYCLYTQDEFLAVIPAFEEIDKAIREESDGLYFLIYRRVKIPDEAIIYEDEDQIVISKEDYERFVAKEDFHEIAEWDDDWSELGA